MLHKRLFTQYLPTNKPPFFGVGCIPSTSIFAAANGCDIFIVEIGGTVGDIESLPFLEAIRQMNFELEQNQNIHMTLILD